MENQHYKLIFELDKAQIQKKELKQKVNKLIHKARSKRDDLVNDLHKRVAYDLVQKYDLILLPTFEVSKMVIKKDDKDRKRKIRKKTVRSMISLSHYKFKVYLKYLAFKYGKLVLDVNESYTSKTLWDGSIKNNLGGSKNIIYKNIKVDRDVHGARNILLRFFTKFCS